MCSTQGKTTQWSQVNHTIRKSNKPWCQDCTLEVIVLQGKTSAFPCILYCLLKLDLNMFPKGPCQKWKYLLGIFIECFVYVVFIFVELQSYYTIQAGLKLQTILLSHLPLCCHYSVLCHVPSFMYLSYLKHNLQCSSSGSQSLRRGWKAKGLCLSRRTNVIMRASLPELHIAQKRMSQGPLHFFTCLPSHYFTL